MRDAAFVDFAARELAKIGLVELGDVLDGTVVRVPKAYPAYFGAYSGIGAVRAWLDQLENVFPVGRNGMHPLQQPGSLDACRQSAVDCIAAGSRDKTALWSVNVEEDYHEETTSGSGSESFSHSA